MRSRYRAHDAEQMVAEYADQPRELALRVYTSRLIGSEPSLVLHGGGNTSAKARTTNLLGDLVDVMWVKGSGSSLDRVTPRDLPAVDLAYLRRLRTLEALSDEEMVNQLRTHLFDASAPNPSVEALLHAFLPHAFVDHSHADAVLAISNRPEGERHVRDALGDDVTVLPYIMPGFPLAKAVADAYEAAPAVKGVVLGLHGLFTFGASAEESYERHIELVDRCEAFVAKHSTPLVTVAHAVANAPLAERVLPALRGAAAERDPEGQVRTRFVCDLRTSPEAIAFASDPRAPEWAASGPLTPDHVIRTKAQPLALTGLPDDDRAADFVRDAVARFRAEYAESFARCSAARGVSRRMLDSAPRVVLVPGVGVVTLGPTKADAAIAADLYERTIATKLSASALGPYRGLGELDLFDMEYWSLEQAKLGKAKPKPLAGRVAIVTGGAGAIGRGVAEELAKEGAHVALVDLRGAGEAAASLREALGEYAAWGFECDVTDEAQVQHTFGEVVRTLGGVDVLVPNAGVALVKSIDHLGLDEARRVVDVNYFGVLSVLRAAGSIFRAQRTGGSVVINSSKNVFAPGKDFAAYSASKAAAHQLGKVAAIELAAIGVRVNMINADGVFSHGETPSGLWAEVGPDRAKSRGLTLAELPEFYRKRNLLGAAVSARDVGRAVVFFASEQTPTTGATLPVDGGVVEAFPR